MLIFVCIVVVISKDMEVTFDSPVMDNIHQQPCNDGLWNSYDYLVPF